MPQVRLGLRGLILTLGPGPLASRLLKKAGVWAEAAWVLGLPGGHQRVCGAGVLRGGRVQGLAASSPQSSPRAQSDGPEASTGLMHSANMPGAGDTAAQRGPWWS